MFSILLIRNIAHTSCRGRRQIARLRRLLFHRVFQARHFWSLPDRQGLEEFYFLFERRDGLLGLVKLFAGYFCQIGI